MPVNPRLVEAGRRLDAMQRARVAAMSHGGQVQGRGVQVGPVGVQRAQRQQVQAVQAQNNQQWEQAKAAYKATQKSQQHQGGFGGFVGGILSNPVVSTIVKPLSVLSYGKNAVQTGILELEEALTESKKTPDWMRWLTVKPEQMNWFTPAAEVRAGRSNLDLIKGKPGEYKGQEKAPIGFGSMTQDLNTGVGFIDNWGDKAIGLAGDIGLDPLSHFSGGLNKVPGATGRLQLAVEAADKGLAPEVARAAGRGGARAVRSIADDAVREEAIKALNLPEAGLRWGGREGFRIPLTGKLDEALNAVTHGVSGLAADRTLGKGVRFLGAARNPATREAVESLVGRGAETLPPEVAAKLVGSAWKETAAHGAFTAALENTARDIAKKGKNDAAIVHAVEAGDLTNPVAAALDDLGKQSLSRQRALGVSVGELAEDKGGYVKRLVTEKGREALQHATSGFGGKAAFGPGGQQFERVFQPGGKYKILGKWYQPVKANIEETNAWALKNIGFKLYEDSPAKLSAEMVREASGSVGKVARLQDIMKAGLAGGWENPAFTTVDKEATRLASKQTGGDLAAQLEPLLRDLTRGEARLSQTGFARDQVGEALQGFDREAMTAQRKAYGEGYTKANEAQAAYEAAQQVPEGHTRLFRGDLAEPPASGGGAGLPDWIKGQPEIQARNSVQGRWFHPDEGVAGMYPTNRDPAELNKLRSVDVPDDVYEQIRNLADQPEAVRALSMDPAEAVVPEHLMGGVRDVPSAPNVDDVVAQHVQPTLDELAQAKTTLTQHKVASDMADLMADVSLATTERQFDEAIAHLPRPAQAMMKVTAAADRSEPAMTRMLGDVAAGKLDDQVVRQANEGFELMRTDRLMGHDLAINSEMKRALDESDQAMHNFNEVMNRDKGLFGRVVDEYTKFFKAWALATPGQHVRNGMSATFMNMSAGVTFPEMLDGNQIWKVWTRYGKGSQLSPTSLLNRSRGAAEVDWVRYLPEELREVAPHVVSAVYASGAGGQYEAMELLQRAFGEGAEGSKVGALLRKTYQNRAIEASHNVGEQVEGRVRSGLALHVLQKDASGSWAEAVSNIKRIHFDYSDVNEIDRGLRRVIPFWTFMSRNLPLQVQQMWTAPKVYSQYQSFMTNVGTDDQGNLLMPEYLRRSGATFLGGGGRPWALAPDVGASQIDNYLGQIADPKSLLSNTNPLAKDLLQLATGQNFYYGDQYKENDYQKPGVEQAIPSALLALIGVGKRTNQGVVQERKVLDVLGDLNPLTAQANRLFSTTANREGKGLASTLNYLGVPLKQVDQAKERKNQTYDARGAQFDAQDLRDALARFGGAA